MGGEGSWALHLCLRTGGTVSKQVHLHNHSEGSFLDGYATVTDMAKRTVELGQGAAAITDHGECVNHLAFQKACLAEGIKPIFGMEGYLHHDIGAAMAAGVYPSDLSHLCLLAKDQKGLSNLWAISSIAYDSRHFYYRPLADHALLREYSEGIYASDGCMMTTLGRAIINGDEDTARQYAAGLLDIYGDNFYIELHTWQFMNPSVDDEVEFFKKKMSTVAANQLMTDVNQAKLRFAREMGVPFVVVNDAHHVRPEDWLKKDMANKINKDKGDQLADGQKADHLMGEDELVYWMARHGIGADVVAEAIENSYRIAENCNAEIKPMLKMPTFTTGEHDDMVAFIDAVEQGFKRKVIEGGLDAETYFRRMEYEVELICQRRFAGYFLTVADYVRAAKDGSWKQYVVSGAERDPMRCGPGRGSAGGALVSWLMGITAVDPIKYDLLFERFLNPDRKGFPDIDVDFPQSRLRDMYRYLQARHGADHVCALATVGRNGPKGMLKDLGRAMKIPYADIEAMSKIIESAIEIVAAEQEAADEQTGQDAEDELTWDRVLSEKGGDLAPYAKRHPELFNLLGEMVGVARNSGKHASGVLINDDPLLGVIPLRTRKHRTADEIVTTQWDMWEIEEMGGVKFDLLGLRHLDTLDGAAKQVAKRHGIDLDFEAFDAELSEPAIWEPIDQGRTTGIFQIETPGTTRTAVDLKPRNELDLAALVSIIRPGVKDAGETERFLKRRAGLEPVRYDHPLMEPITSETYGILVYQEQMIRAAKDLAGFTAGEADELRKVTAKKLADKIAPFEAKFRDGCLANPEFMAAVNGNQKAAEKAITKIWASINASARYSFNKSHAVGYSLISNWETWLSYHYPPEYVVELMATDSKNINRYVREARRQGIPILPPDINESGRKFTLTDDAIRYGLDTVDKVGDAAAADILEKRPYTSYTDFLERTKLNKTQIINLIRIGAFDSLAYDPERDGDWIPTCRTRLLQQYHEHRVWMKVAPGKRAKLEESNQRAAHLETWFANFVTRKGQAAFDAEFGLPDFTDPDVIYEIEQELVGNYVLVDPMEPYLAALDAVAIKDPSELTERTVGDVFVIGGQVSKVKKHIVKNGRSAGQEMAFIGVTFNETDFDITVFSETWREVKSIIKEGVPVACQVIRDNRGCHLSSVERLDLLWAEAS
ncbi:DNA polymerase III alpha subunit [Mycobacterium phage Phrappuccino]|uniref:DNA-directed DNA polymerase n=1 Tax=Mycobacterium phage Phrappuccino TaxID=2591223 RepID=A0A514DDV6_9CAUD|nr:DNA polymerase [Mycobacterium phage Phrappuccino]QDH91794.1 DNA polymerase III alpha subunit [Mycobacterium phage Phrappuccino]QIQ63236.1 DNA polymerase III alpha subunit [Mycobacterium phage Settecandela]